MFLLDKHLLLPLHREKKEKSEHISVDQSSNIEGLTAQVWLNEKELFWWHYQPFSHLLGRLQFDTIAVYYSIHMYLILLAY